MSDKPCSSLLPQPRYARAAIFCANASMLGDPGVRHSRYLLYLSHLSPTQSARVDVLVILIVVGIQKQQVVSQLLRLHTDQTVQQSMSYTNRCKVVRKDHRLVRHIVARIGCPTVHWHCPAHAQRHRQAHIHSTLTTAAETASRSCSPHRWRSQRTGRTCTRQCGRKTAVDIIRHAAT
jgi:hypothetical protein